MLNYQLLLRRLSALFLHPAHNFTYIMTPEYLLATINASRETFVPIFRKPKDGDHLCLR